MQILEEIEVEKNVSKRQTFSIFKKIEIAKDAI